MKLFGLGKTIDPVLPQDGVARPQTVDVPGARDIGFKGTKRKLDTTPVKELYPTAIRKADVDSLEKAAGVVAGLLGDRALEAEIIDVAQGLKGKTRTAFEASLAGYALLADSALTMLDYDKLTTGWDGFGQVASKYPESKGEYLARAYRPGIERTSRPRQNASRISLDETLRAALASNTPGPALDAALIASFFAEVGIAPAISADWKPSAEAVQATLAADGLIPLRALYAAAAHLDHSGVPMKGHKKDELNALSRTLIEQVVRHLSEGDFDDWRFNKPESKTQLESLSADQLATYRAPSSITLKTRRGFEIKTRDEQGFGLAWVTKIGGPSHGFDMISQCLFPLLVNGRNGAIVVDDPNHPNAARSVLRMLPTTDGKPMLYLEMLQVDYPYDVRARASEDELRLAIVGHALNKAKAMGVPLAISSSKWESAEGRAASLGVKGERKQLEIILEKSGAVFESSDTLLGAHHAPQLEREIVRIPREVPLVQLYSPFPYVIQP